MINHKPLLPNIHCWVLHYVSSPFKQMQTSHDKLHKGKPTFIRTCLPYFIRPQIFVTNEQFVIWQKFLVSEKKHHDWQLFLKFTLPIRFIYNYLHPKKIQIHSRTSFLASHVNDYNPCLRNFLKLLRTATENSKFLRN